MVYSEYIMDIYIPSKTSIGTVIRNVKPEMLKFVPDHLKAKKYVSMQLKIYLIY